MDVLDSLDLDTKSKKSFRVRSWYLYEQYKSLEKHQLDAAQKLKNRSYQDNILRQELLERRARRKVYDQFGLCQSESSIQKTISNHTAHAPALSASTDDFFESYNEQDDERVTRETEFDYNEDLTNKTSVEDYKSVHEQNDNVSYSDSVTSVVENVVTADIDDDNDNNTIEHSNSVIETFIPFLDESNEYEHTDDREITPVIIAQDLNKQLDSVREDIQCLQNIATLELDTAEEDFQCLEEAKFDDNSSNNMSDCSHNVYLQKILDEENKKENDYNQIIPIWSKIVSFAFQIVQLNHGNCYCDYSSQVLTAFLAWDILRRGVCRMCNILQPYVSPISFVTDDNNSDIYYKSGKIKKSVQSRKSTKVIENKFMRRMKRYSNSSRLAHKNYSENCWNSCMKRTTSFEKHSKSKYSRRASEPWRRSTRNPFRETLSSSNSSIWSQKDMSRRMFKSCTCCKKAVNPMLKIARYIDSILKDINDV